MLFDRICRDNGIAHRLTPPASPTTTGKVERFHQSLRRELLDGAVPFTDLATAQAAIDAWVVDYNTTRPHQALAMAYPADRFAPASRADQELVPLRLPATLTLAPPAGPHATSAGDRPWVASPATGLDRSGGRVRPHRARQRQPRRGRQAVLARPRQGRRHRHLLGRQPGHPPADRWHPSQVAALALVQPRPGACSPPAAAAPPARHPWLLPTLPATRSRSTGP